MELKISMEEIVAPSVEEKRKIKYLAMCSYIGLNYSGF